MPYRKRRSYRKRPKKSFKRSFKRRIPRSLKGPGKIYSYVQSCSRLGDLSVSGGTEAFFGVIFRLSDLGTGAAGNLDAFTALYDSYRIMAVKITFFPKFTQVNAASSSINMPYIYTSIDRDSGAAPTSVDELEQYQTVRQQMLNRPHSRYFKPVSLSVSAASASGNIGQYSISRKTWHDIATPSINYYGLKIAVSAGVVANIPAMDIKVVTKLYVQFRNVR